VRQQLRHGTAFYVDHIVDSFGGLALMAGLALSGYTHPYVAIGLLVAFLLLSIQSSWPRTRWRISAFVLELWAEPSRASCWQWGTGTSICHHLSRTVTGCLDVAASSGLSACPVMLICFTARNTVRSLRGAIR